MDRSVGVSVGQSVSQSVASQSVNDVSLVCVQIIDFIADTPTRILK